MNPNLSNVITVEPNKITATETNDSRFKGTGTQLSVRNAIEEGKQGDILPIITLKNPFSSIDQAVKVYREFTQQFSRPGGQHYEGEERILHDLLGNPDLLLCYNGHRRLAEFKRAGISIKTIAIRSQEQFDRIPEDEKRFPDSKKNERTLDYQIDRNYQLTFIRLIDDVVFLTAKAQAWDSLDTSELLAKMRQRRAKRLEENSNDS